MGLRGNLLWALERQINIPYVLRIGRVRYIFHHRISTLSYLHFLSLEVRHEQGTIEALHHYFEDIWVFRDRPNLMLAETTVFPQ